MGFTNSPYHACKAVTWAKELDLGNRKDKENSFKW